MEKKGPLKGIKVVDLTTVVAGPMAIQVLCDMGADVIKIENTDYPGDSYRFAGSFRINRTEVGKELMGGCYYSVNRGKRCIGLNLKNPDGKAVLLKMLKTADVLMMNMRPAAAARLGIGYEQLKDINPDLIYCASTGWGTTGPMSLAKAYDPIIQATGGSIASQARPTRQGGADVHCINNIIMDKTTAMASAQAILAALFARSRGEGGQKIDISMLDVGLYWNWCDLFADKVFVNQKDDYKQSQGIVPEAFGTAKTSDGKYVIVVATEVDQFAKAFNRPDIAAKKATSVTVRDEMAAEVGKHTLADVLKKFKDFDIAGVEVPTTVEDVLDHPQVKHNQTVELHKDPNFGEVLLARPPAQFSKTPLQIPGRAPLHCEHTAEVLKEMGYSSAEIDKMKADGAISTGGGMLNAKL